MVLIWVARSLYICNWHQNSTCEESNIKQVVKETDFVDHQGKSDGFAGLQSVIINLYVSAIYTEDDFGSNLNREHNTHSK